MARVFVKVSGDPTNYSVEVRSIDPGEIEKELNLGTFGPLFFQAMTEGFPVMLRASLVTSVDLIDVGDKQKEITEREVKKNDDERKNLDDRRANIGRTILSKPR